MLALSIFILGLVGCTFVLSLFSMNFDFVKTLTLGVLMAVWICLISIWRELGEMWKGLSEEGEHEDG